MRSTEQGSKPTNKRASKRASERANERASKRASERTSERANERALLCKYIGQFFAKIFDIYSALNSFEDTCYDVKCKFFISSSLLRVQFFFENNQIQLDKKKSYLIKEETFDPNFFLTHFFATCAVLF